MGKVQIVWFRDLVRWDIKSNFNLSLQSKHKQILFENFLSKAEVEYEELDPNKDYNILGVRSYGLGVYHNRTAKGKTLIKKTTKRYQKIQKGNLFWCKVDTKNGAFGITLAEHIDYYASHNMIQAKVDTTQIDLLFLQYLFSCKFFQQFLDSQVAGTTNRQYISFKELLKIKIPLPPLEIQQEIVAKIESIKAQIKALQEEEKRLKDEIEAYIYIALGLEKKQEAPRQKVFIIRFKDLERWDTRHNQSLAINLCAPDSAPCHTNLEQNQREVSANTESKRDVSPTLNTTNDYKALLDSIPSPPPQGWEMAKLDKVLEAIDTKAFIPLESSFQYLGLEHIQKGGKYFAPITTDSRSIKSSSIVLKNGYIYYSKLRPYLKKIFYYNSSEKCYASSELIGLKFKENKTYPLFALNVLLSDFVSKQEQSTSGARMPRVNIADIKNIKIPLPPLEVQEKTINAIESIESKIALIDSKLESLEARKAQILKETLSDSNERERENRLSLKKS